MPPHGRDVEEVALSKNRLVPRDAPQAPVAKSSASWARSISGTRRRVAASALRSSWFFLDDSV